MPDVEIILQTIRSRESGGNYSEHSYKPGSTASGAYQFTDPTWGGYGGYAHAWQAPAELQDQHARDLVNQYLNMFGGDVRYVPTAWYVGPGGASRYGPDSPYVPRYNRISIRDYVAGWMTLYNSLGGYLGDAVAQGTPVDYTYTSPSPSNGGNGGGDGSTQIDLPVPATEQGIFDFTSLLQPANLIIIGAVVGLLFVLSSSTGMTGEDP